MSNRVSSFAFLQTMNSGGVPQSDPRSALPHVSAPAPGFDQEASAKLVLHELASHDGPATRHDLGNTAGLSGPEAETVFKYLDESGLTISSDAGVMLSSFGKDALSVFTIV